MSNDVKEPRQAPASPPWLVPTAVYVHVPFCAHRCCYCDFATVAGQDDLRDRYLDALEREIAGIGSPQPARTLFIGGGTPTHLTHLQLERLLEIVRRWFVLRPDYEWTVEANPGTLDAAKVNLLADFGVNRVSLGAQSFHSPLLRFLERNHGPKEIHDAVRLVRRRIENISLDLIFAIPGQELSTWKRDLHDALALGPKHLSTYGLTYEKGTPLWKNLQRGKVRPVAEELEQAMYEAAMDTLTEAGFEHYEISNFAQPGHACRHNLVYWANHAYWGFGLGAAAYVNGVRSVNTRDLAAYLRLVESGQPPRQSEERLSDLERAGETAMLQIRRGIGIVRESFAEQTGYDLDALFGETVCRHVESGLLEDPGPSIRLTRKGKLLADLVAADFVYLHRLGH
ncbi:MAG: radical SAM family heme chaperone HemW [Gemmatales bacterium]|nr:radical SAM family heme chaperone HemW [Gemmatales bacterium]MDW8388089.1 radical SAM family heme chaperone HemW [Gemmatales bacterium]